MGINFLEALYYDRPKRTHYRLGFFRKKDGTWHAELHTKKDFSHPVKDREWVHVGIIEGTSNADIRETLKIAGQHMVDEYGFVDNE